MYRLDCFQESPRTISFIIIYIIILRSEHIRNIFIIPKLGFLFVTFRGEKRLFLGSFASYLNGFSLTLQGSNPPLSQTQSPPSLHQTQNYAYLNFPRQILVRLVLLLHSEKGEELVKHSRKKQFCEGDEKREDWSCTGRILDLSMKIMHYVLFLPQVSPIFSLIQSQILRVKMR